MNSKIDKIEIGEPTAIKARAERRTIYIELTDSRIIGFPADPLIPILFPKRSKTLSL